MANVVSTEYQRLLASSYFSALCHPLLDVGLTQQFPLLSIFCSFCPVFSDHFPIHSSTLLLFVSSGRQAGVFAIHLSWLCLAICQGPFPLKVCYMIYDVTALVFRIFFTDCISQRNTEHSNVAWSCAGQLASLRYILYGLLFPYHTASSKTQESYTLLFTFIGSSGFLKIYDSFPKATQVTERGILPAERHSPRYY